MEKDFETDSNGRITKINNWNSKKAVWYYAYINMDKNCWVIDNWNSQYLGNLLELGEIFETKKDLEKYLQWKKTHIKILNYCKKNDLDFQYFYLSLFKYNKKEKKYYYCYEDFEGEVCKEPTEEKELLKTISFKELQDYLKTNY